MVISQKPKINSAGYVYGTLQTILWQIMILGYKHVVGAQ